jgi:hypothetical protein
MPRQLLVGPLLLLFGVFSAAQTVEVKKAPITYVSPASGQQMYAT